ncbi:MAG: serine--tRNA ligase [Thermoanaerobaculaceae bacterium]|nr:serine--tRNA ligase [Thermoanaerobaculaceae bacterium]MDI9622462.1 serine--tRNA ligase [Acidobacteriota bacterium]NLH11217.1 serine--tRNA ligase [Holophagae bacterium]HPW54363.1 serine--tRNA ligase [Thermoanaerobaculaceae bacterium]
MLARELYRTNPDRVRAALADRRSDAPLDRLLEVDARWRQVLAEVEGLKAERNRGSKQIGQLFAAGRRDEADAAKARMSALGARIAELEAGAARLGEEMAELELVIPNLPHESVPVGPDETANRVERTWGEPPTFDFEPRAHWDLGPGLGILDFERAAKVAGARFAVLWGMGAALERALVTFMLDLHRGRGYEEVYVPFVVNRQALRGTGQIPKFEQDLFHLEGTDYYLVPTAEVPVTNLYAGEILEEAALPKRLCAYTPCFRAEAGSHGRDVRGLIRQHQFDKVELVHLATPERSYEELEMLTASAELVLQRLGLAYRVVTLSTGDMGFAAACTRDLEVWLPGQGCYREISSCSNCEDFQARRMELRFRPTGGGKLRLVHTLNGSGVAVGRTLIAVLENFQQVDGSVVIPEALRPYLDGVERLTPRG